MADQRTGQKPPESPPDVTVESRLRTSAGTPITTQLVITNRAAEPRVMVVSVLGLDEAWAPAPSRSRPLEPGESIAADVTLSPAVGTVPARYPLSIAVQAIHPDTDESTAPTRIAELELVVDAPGQIAVGLEPAEAIAVFGKKITVTLHNTGTISAPVHLEVIAPQSTHLSTQTDEVAVQAGETVRVPGRIRVVKPRMFGPRERHTYTVTARSGGAPRHAEGSLTARALFGPSGTKFVAILAVIAIWVAMAILFIPRLSQNVRNKEAAGPSAAASATASPGGSSSPGGSGSASPGGSGSASPGAPGAVKSGNVQLNGTVSGRSPGNVSVGLRPTSLVDEEAVGAVPVGVTTQSSDEVGMVPESALTVIPVGTVSTSRGATTGADGAWSFVNVRAPGYYLLTFAKPGYQTQRYVVDASSVVATQPLKVTLVPGTGRLSGTVSGPSGPVGAADITITDGTNTITTSSNSKGGIGAWTVTGLSTPSTYLVMAGKDGMSTESALVSLGAGGSRAVSLTLTRGVGSLVGKVSGVNSLGVMGGLGGVQVTATNGTITRTATTVTRGPVGYYTLSDLPPGTYAVTIEATGYLPQTHRVTLRKGASSVRVNAVLTSSTATVAGYVTTRGGAAINGAGLILTAATARYKATSRSDGSFGISGVAPGTYVLSAEYFGYATGYATVKALAGQWSRVTLRLTPQVTTGFSWIHGWVADAEKPGNICPADPTKCLVVFTLHTASDATTKVRISSDNRTFGDQVETQPSSEGPTEYTLYGEGGLVPGLYRLTIAVTTTATTSATAYMPQTVRVQVPLNGEATAPQVNLFRTNTIMGTINAAGNLMMDGPPPVPHLNCVYAYPVGSGRPMPTTCLADQAAADTYNKASMCLIDGTPGNGYSFIGDPANPGTAGDPTSDSKQYSINNLCDGTYIVYVVITNHDYVTPAPNATQTVSHGQTVNYSPTVDRKGQVAITLYRDNNGTPELWTGTFEGKAWCGTQPAPGSEYDRLLTSTTGKITVTGVDAGIWTCTARTTGGMVGSISGVNVTNNSTKDVNILLHEEVGDFSGRVISNFQTGTGASAVYPTPVSGATVRVDGVVGYDGTSPIMGWTTASTGADGTFAITRGTGAGQLTLLSTAVTITVTPPGGYYTPAATKTTIASGTIPDLTLTPTPVPMSVVMVVSVNTVSGTARYPDEATITVDKTEAEGSGTTVTVTADHLSGVLTWRDSNYGSNIGAWPGTYTLTARLTGYADATMEVRCTVNASCLPTSGSLTLFQLGGLSGTVVGILAKSPETSPTQPIVGATVKVGNLADATCATPLYRATTNASGVFTVTGTSTNYVLEPNTTYRLCVSAPGYAANNDGTVFVTNGDNTAAQTALYIDLVEVHIGVNTASGGKTELTSTATVQICPQSGTAACVTNSTADADGTYHFTDIVPTVSYQVNISGGDILPATYYFTAVLTTTPQDFTFAVSVVKNVVSGTVTGIQGENLQPSGLNGVTVDLGTVDGGGNFTVGKDSDGTALTTTSENYLGNDGYYTFSSVKNGNYRIRFTMYGYVQQIPATSIQVKGGTSVSLPAVQLVRVTQKVTVTVTTSTGNDPSGWQAGLTAVQNGTPSGTWKLAADSFPTSTPPYSWVFNQVPYGCWSFGLTLPDGHYGTMSLTTVPPEDPNITQCASTSGHFAVPGTGSTEVTPGYTLDERELDLAVTATPISPDPSPSTADVTVKNSANAAVYHNAAFTVGPGGTTVLWLPNDTYSVTATSADQTNFPSWIWPDDSETGVALVATGPTSVTLSLDEIPRLAVTVVDQGATGNEAHLTITPAQGLPAAYVNGVDTSGLTATLYLPAGSWNIKATIGAKESPLTPVTMTAHTETTVTLTVPAP